MKKYHLAGKIVEDKKKKAKKKAKRRLRRILFCLCGGLCLLGTGYFLGVHRRVIAAYLKGEVLPKAPEGHACHK